jgi:hypothetical protein
MAKKTQIQVFRDAARKLHADESEEGFGSALRHIGRQIEPDAGKRKSAPSKTKKDRVK